jgi:hypothetical protein
LGLPRLSKERGLCINFALANPLYLASHPVLNPTSTSSSCTIYNITAANRSTEVNDSSEKTPRVIYILIGSAMRLEEYASWIQMKFDFFEVLENNYIPRNRGIESPRMNEDHFTCPKNLILAIVLTMS